MKKLIYIILISGLVFLSYKFLEQKTYIKKLKKDSIELEKSLESFSFNFFGLYPENQSDIHRMLSWTKAVSGPVNIKSINNGFNVYYDSDLNKIIIYSFGKDNEDSKLQDTPFNSSSLNQNGQFDIFSINIFKYIYYSFKSNDIILTTFNVPELDCAYLMNTFEKKHKIEIFPKDISLLETENYLYTFMKKIKVFEQNYLKLESHENLVNSRYYFMYKGESLTLMCSDNTTNENNLEKLKIDLMNFIEDNNLNYIEYALFPVSFSLKNGSGSGSN